MLRNYLKMAWRTLLKHRGHALINVVGLAMGLAVCLLIGLWIRHELSFDRFHKKADRIYRVTTAVNTEGTLQTMANAGGPVGPTMQAELPDVLRAARLFRASFLVRRGQHSFQERNLYYADSTLFDVFTIPFVQGNPETALTAPYSVVLTEEAAQRYFGDEDPIGKTLEADRTHTLTVTGVVKAMPANSHFSFDLLLSMETLEQLQPARADDWPLVGFFTYILLPDDYDVERLEGKLPAFAERHTRARMAPFNGSLSLVLEPLPDIYLHSDLPGQIGPTASPETLYVFGFVALFVLLVAGVNFINLATARATVRAKEVGVRKAMGAGRGQLVGQHLLESILLALAAMVLALGMALVLRPVFELLTGVSLVTTGLWTVPTLGVLLGASLMVGLVAGSYPAFVLSRFSPIRTLRGQAQPTTGGATPRRVLVTVQLGISIALLACTAVVFQQVHHLQTQDPGFERDHMLVINFAGDRVVQRRAASIKRELAQHPAVASASMSSTTPGRPNALAGLRLEEMQGEWRTIHLNLYRVDFDFEAQYGLHVVAGRSFSRRFPTDSTEAMVINEAAVRAMDYSSNEDALGKRFEWIGRSGTVVGVVEDFHFRTLRTSVAPLAMWVDPSTYAFLTLKLRGEDTRHAVSELAARWKEIVPDRPFTYTFLEETLAQQYHADERFGQVIGLFAGLALLIACLGLFGLASFVTEQRTKEIGIRKVLGASMSSIVALFSTDFLKPVVVAAVLASPVAYLAMQQWLANFTNRIELGPGVFVLVSLGALLVALVAVSVQTVRAARIDPATTLRDE